MKFFCVYTQTHEALFSQYFRPSLAPSLEDGKAELVAVTLPQEGGVLGTNAYLRGLATKLDCLLSCLRENPGEIIVSTDVDIVFLRPAAEELRRYLGESGKDILFQREGKRLDYANGGFYVCRSTGAVIQFIEAVRRGMDAAPEKTDQEIANELLQGGYPLNHGFLPLTCYARTHGWPPPRDILLYHANASLGKDFIDSKVRQFRELAFIRRYGWPAVLWTSFLKIPKRLRRWLGMGAT